MGDLPGRAPQLSRLEAALASARAGRRSVVMVVGEAGMGKTSLLRAAIAAAGTAGMRVAWGGCPDTVGVPGLWPWTQAMGALVRALGGSAAREVAGEDAAVLARYVPGLGAPADPAAAERDRFLLFDATARFLAAAGAQAPVLLVLDDLQWADESSLLLFDVLARDPQPARLCVLAAYRPDEVPPRFRERLRGCGEHMEVPGLDVEAVHAVVREIRGAEVEPEVSAAIHARTRGHPFFVREVAACAEGRIPPAVAELLQRRIDALGPAARAVVQTLAVLGGPARPDVLAAALQTDAASLEDAVREATASGVLVPPGPQFAHDLLRETVLAGIGGTDRLRLHQALGGALADRAGRAADVPPAEIARQFVGAIPVDGPDRALRWARAAAAADHAAAAFGEAAGHLRRLRAAVADAGHQLRDDALLEVLLEEAEALALAGTPIDARGLLRAARVVARRLDDPAALANVALRSAGLGSRFAIRRDEIVAELEEALLAVAGRDPAREAQVAAALARELQHSVADDRPRAAPLSERALRLGRECGDPATLAACLLARHDILWTPGAAQARAEIAREIVRVADAAGDRERRADGLLLLATALLEQGSAAFRPTVSEALHILDGLRAPRHRYTSLSRQAAIALIQGELDTAEELVETAAALGARIREPDTGNVRMSQRIELVRARHRPEELRRFADEAVEHWTGAPVHAHSVAAGFCARAGDVPTARRHLAAVADLGGWRADTSYLQAVYVRELAEAAIAAEEEQLATDLLGHLLPLAGGCGVNAAMIAFAGSYAHSAGRLARALGRPEAAGLLAAAASAYRRLGAAGWLAEVSADQEVPAAAGAALRRCGPVWELRFGARTATVGHAKGLQDLARLIAADGREVHVLDLMEAADRSGPGGEIADRTALAAYRRRITDLDEEIAVADRNGDLARSTLLVTERQALLDELGRGSGAGGRPRQFANTPTERARKAVAARIGDALRRVEEGLPEMAAHLRRHLVTGTYCRYRTNEGLRWDLHLE